MMVEMMGLEPMLSRLSDVCFNQLSYISKGILRGTFIYYVPSMKLYLFIFKGWMLVNKQHPMKNNITTFNKMTLYSKTNTKLNICYDIILSYLTKKSILFLKKLYFFYRFCRFCFFLAFIRCKLVIINSI